METTMSKTNYFKVKLHSVILSHIYTDCVHNVGKQRTATIKPEYLPLISSNLVIYNEHLRLLDSVGQGE